ncbi:MAG: hypothetical protein ACHP9Z_08950 [Streptosporangiales bacterium]
MAAVIILIAVGYLLFHAGHSHANYRRGANLYWSSARGPWVSVPGPFGTRIGHRL